MSPRPTFLQDSLRRLEAITLATHSPQTTPIANGIWRKHLQKQNPLWGFVTAKQFYIESRGESAHVIAMIDKRLPKFGLLGYFGCTNSIIGVQVINQALQWFKDSQGIKEVYGPINGTAISDYRFNMSEDYWFPGEPVNPGFYIDAFKHAGFKTFNHYVSGRVRQYQLFTKLFVKKPHVHDNYRIRPFDDKQPDRDLKIFHELMVTIFPEQSIYCPPLSWKERVYNFQGKNPYFNPRYTYFLEHQTKPVGVIVAFPYEGKLIIKTVGILPQYRGKHLSGLLIHKVHEVAAADGLSQAIYAMVREGNSIYKMRKPGVRIARHYITMKKKI